MTAKLWNVGTNNAVQTTLNGNIDDVDTSIILASATGLQAPGVVVIDRIDANEVETPTLREYVSFTGISTNTLTGCDRSGLGGSTAQSHNSGATVEEVFSATQWNDLIDFLEVAHDANGNIDALTITDAALTTPQITTSINDSGGNEIIKTPATASAVNEITITNAATNNSPDISATGGDSNINLDLTPKGTGFVLQGRVPVACVYNNANVSINNNSDTALTWNAEVFDNNSIHSTSSNTDRLTITDAGLYLVSFKIMWVANGTGRRVAYITQNGTGVVGTSVEQISDDTDTTTCSGAFLVDCAANDIIRIVVYQNSGIALNTLGGSTHECSSTSIVRVGGRV